MRTMPNMLHRATTKQLEGWYKVAKRSGLFRDPRDMRTLRNILQSRRRCRMTLR
jgi:hypothetical protein